MDRASSTVPATDPELTIVRRFDAPRDLVYRMWSERTFFEQWWGCEDSMVVSCTMDVRPEGAWHIAIQMADGVIHNNGGRYLSVVENEQLVYSEGNAVNTITFSDEGDATRVTIHIRLQSLEDRDRLLEFGVVTGIGLSLDRVAHLLTRFGSRS